MESVFVEQLVNQWASLGHHCYVISPFSITTFLRKHCAYGIVHERRFVNQTAIEIYKPRIIGIPGKIGNVAISSYEAQCAIMRIVETLNVKFDFVYCHFFIQGVRAFRFAQVFNLPLFIATGESTIPLIHKPNKDFSWSDFKKYARGVICVSQKNKYEAIERGYVDESKCVVIPNAVDTNTFHKMPKQEARKKIGLSERDFVIVCVGEFSERKGQIRIIKAINRLSQKERVKILLIGKGDKRIEDVHIAFQGTVKHDELPLYLNSSDVFVLPTLREGCCNAIIEAMACGLPIISSDRDFNYDILSSSFAQMVDPMNVQEISSAIDLYMRDEIRRKNDAEMCYKQSLNLSLEKRANTILNFIQQHL